MELINRKFYDAICHFDFTPSKQTLDLVFNLIERVRQLFLPLPSSLTPLIGVICCGTKLG